MVGNTCFSVIMAGFPAIKKRTGAKAPIRCFLSGRAGRNEICSDMFPLVFPAVYQNEVPNAVHRSFSFVMIRSASVPVAGVGW